MKHFISIFLIILVAFIACKNGEDNKGKIVNTIDTIDTSLAQKGKIIFIQECGMCHGGKEKTDNYLEGVVQRLGKSFLVTYITNEDSLLAAKNKYVLDLIKEYNNARGKHNNKYSVDTLNAIIEYLK